MKDEAKCWILSFLITTIFLIFAADLYLICYNCPDFYGVMLRFFGGTGEIAPPRSVMTRLAVCAIPCTLVVRVALFAASCCDKNEGSDKDER